MFSVGFVLLFVLLIFLLVVAVALLPVKPVFLFTVETEDFFFAVETEDFLFEDVVN